VEIVALVEGHLARRLLGLGARLLGRGVLGGAALHGVADGRLATLRRGLGCGGRLAPLGLSTLGLADLRLTARSLTALGLATLLRSSLRGALLGGRGGLRGTALLRCGTLDRAEGALVGATVRGAAVEAGGDDGDAHLVTEGIVDDGAEDDV